MYAKKLICLVALIAFCFFVASCGKNPVGIGSSPLGLSSSSSIGKYKTEEGKCQISSNPSNTQTLTNNSLNSCTSALTAAGISFGGPTSTIKLDSKVFPFCVQPLAPPSGYSGPASGPDGKSGWYKYTWSTSQSGITSSGDSYIKTSPGDYYADSNAAVKTVDWWTISQGNFNTSGCSGSYNFNTQYHVIGISSEKIGGYFRYDGSSTYDGGSYKWDWQWDFEVSTVETDKSGKHSWYSTYTKPYGSGPYSGNIAYKSDGSGDGKVYQNSSLVLTIHWDAGGKLGYYITSDGQKHDFGGC